MRKITLASALLILLATPQFTSAFTLDALSGSADCNGWNANVDIVVRDGAFMGQLEYAVVLRDADGFEVQRFDYSGMLDPLAGPMLSFLVGGDWDAPLDGTYTVEGQFWVYDITAGGNNTTSDGFSIDPGCGGAVDPAGDGCTHTADFWLENPGLWPVDRLVVGDREMDRSELESVLQMRRHCLLMFALMREQIVAKLNLASGAPDLIAGTVDKTDAFLASAATPRRGHRGRGHGGREYGQAMRLQAELHRYNRSGCPDGSGILTLTYDDVEYGVVGKAAVEDMSLGTVKAMYR